MKLFRTLRARFALWTAGLLCGALVLFGLLVYVNMSRNMIAAVDEKLRLAVLHLISEAEVSQGEIIFVEHLTEYVQSADVGDEGFTVKIFDLEGNVIQVDGRHANLPPPQLDRITDVQSGYVTTLTDPDYGVSLRLYTAPLLEADTIVGISQVAQPLDSVWRTLNLLAATLLIGGPLIMVGAGIGAYFLTARALAPIDAITHTARHLSVNQLSERLNLAETDDEVGRLAATFDSMLARLEDAFRRERQFIADASHELRTPLAAMKTIIDTTLSRQRTAQEYEIAMSDLGTEVEHMRRMAAGLLDLARNDLIEQTAQPEVIDLSVLLKDLIESVRPIAEEKEITIRDEVANESLNVQGERDGLIRLFLNILDNAIKYTEAGEITLRTGTSEQDHLLVTISDTGAGIPQESLLHIFDPFYQVDESRSENGVGLGLSIAQQLAKQNGGTISVESQEAHGTTFSVQLRRFPKC